MLELVNVKKIYTTKAGDTSALNNVSIVFPKTGMVFITGKSGSGKTTMLNVIGGLDGIDGGDLIIEGKKFSEFTRADYDSYRNTFVGFIFQEYNLLPEYTVAKNISMANELQGRPTDAKELENLLELVDIGGYGSRKISQLSGGQKQRVAIARALIKNPQIIMADEPTGALDSATGIQVMETLKKLSKEKLIIVVSHDLELAEKYADRIVRLVDGEIVDDVTLSDVEFNGSLYENENEITVKSGGDLTKAETDSLVSAIKQKKKIRVADTISIKEKAKTKPIKVEKPDKPVKLINSKMKLKSAIDLGVKSLFVKPFRLIITVLLSVIAFAVFGLFDSVASFTGAKVIANQLKESGHPVISLYATIDDDNYDGEVLKISQEYIDNLNKKTGYNFRGVYDINDAEKVDTMDSRSNVNKQYRITSIGDRGIDSPSGIGVNYYNMNINGYVEFKNSEINAETGVIDEGGFNYKILNYENSAYPVYNAEKANEGVQVAISSFTADAICYWHNKMGRYKDDENYKPYTPQDLIGKKINFSSYKNIAHVITAIIDCGEIPEKYDELKTIVTSEKTAMLEQDFKTYLSSCGFLNFFVADGYIEASQQKNNRITTYVDNYLEYSYTAEPSGKVGNSTPNVTSFRYYNEKDFTDKNVFLFETGKDDTPVAPSLKANETLIHVNNLEFLFKHEFAIVYENDKYEKALSNARSAITLMQTETDYTKKRDAFNNFMENLNVLYEFLNTERAEIFNLNNDDTRDDKVLTIKTKSGLEILEENKFVVKGVYFGVDTDYVVGKYSKSTLGALVLSNDALKSLGITTEQGKFSRLISPTNESRMATNALSKYMSKDNGVKLNWFQNNVLAMVEDAKVIVKQFSNLFLYVSIALALFAVFMLFNYISASIVSKRQSIGVLRALGADGKNIFEMFITESLIISIINGILACIVANVACYFVNYYVIQVMNISISFALFGVRQVLVIMGASLLTGILSSLIPIIRIAKEKPVDLIRKI